LRLFKLEDEFAGRVKLVWKSYPLAVDDNKNRRYAGKSAVSWLRAMEEEKGLNFRPHPAGDPAPTSSLPSHIAAKAAMLQSEDAAVVLECSGGALSAEAQAELREMKGAFRRYHMKLLEAHFERWLDISDQRVLLDLAREAGLDAARLERDMADPRWKELVLAEKEEGDRDYKDWGPGVPLAVFGNRFPVLGAVPIEMYRHAVRRLLGQEPKPRWAISV